jgi:hypothetical protein
MDFSGRIAGMIATRFILFSHLFIVLVLLSLPPLLAPSPLPILHVHVPEPARMTSHAPPRLSSHSSHQPWRKVDEKPTHLSSLSSTLKMGSTRGWLASNPRDTIPMHHRQKSGSDTLEWKGFTTTPWSPHQSQESDPQCPPIFRPSS